MSKKLNGNINFFNHEAIGYSYVPPYVGNYISIGTDM